MSAQEILDRIRTITDLDLNFKSRKQLFASPVEELGELAREISIAKGVFGKAHRQPDEGVLPEAVDLFICAAALGKIRESEIQFCFTLDNHTDPFDLLRNCVNCLSAENWETLTINTICIFRHFGGTFEQFIELCNKKLDKWESSQKELLKCTQQPS